MQTNTTMMTIAPNAAKLNQPLPNIVVKRMLLLYTSNIQEPFAYFLIHIY